MSRPDEISFNEMKNPYPEVELMGVIDEYTPDMDDMIIAAQSRGIDINNPELMGAFVRKIAKRIISRIKKAKRKKKGFTVKTPKNIMSITDSGIDISKATAPAAPAAPSMFPQAGILGNIPPAMLIGIPLFFVSMIMKRKKRK